MRLAYLSPRPDPYVVKALRDAGHMVELVDRHGLAEARFDALILDLPDASAEVVREIAALAGGGFVLVFGAPAGGGDQAGLLRAGADACFARPVSVLELQARLEALERSAGRRDGEAQVSRLRLIPAERAVALAGRTIALTAQEYRVLEALALRPGEVLTPSALVRLAWGEAAEVDPALVSTYVSRLRAKLEPVLGAELIRAVRGHGYRFEVA